MILLRIGLMQDMQCFQCRMLEDSSQFAQIVAQAQLVPTQNNLAPPFLADTHLPGGYPSPSSRPYPGFGSPRAGNFPLQSHSQPQVPSNALRGNASWAMPSALNMGHGRGGEGYIGVRTLQGGEGYIGVRTLPSKAGVVVYMANLGELVFTQENVSLHLPLMHMISYNPVCLFWAVVCRPVTQSQFHVSVFPGAATTVRLRPLGLDLELRRKQHFKTLAGPKFQYA